MTSKPEKKTKTKTCKEGLILKKSKLKRKMLQIRFDSSSVKESFKWSPYLYFSFLMLCWVFVLLYSLNVVSILKKID